jgi:hypothetical protein
MPTNTDNTLVEPLENVFMSRNLLTLQVGAVVQSFGPGGVVRRIRQRL